MKGSVNKQMINETCHDVQGKIINNCQIALKMEDAREKNV